jgi:hypothetical protein
MKQKPEVVKKNRFIYFVLALLIIVAGYLVIQNRSGSRSAQDFSVNDTADIQFISIESGNQNVVLTRDGKSWKVNSRFPAGREKVGGLLILLSRVKISGTVGAALREEVGNAMGQSGKKIIIADSKKVIRSFIVYHDAHISDHTYMIHENGHTIYRVEIPGVKYRNLDVLFHPEAAFWRSNVLFQYRPDEISYVKCVFPAHPEHSFIIVHEPNAPPGIFSAPDSTALENIDEDLAWRYLSYFSRVILDEYLADPGGHIPGEFPGDRPEVRIRVADTKGNTIVIESYSVYYKDSNGIVKKNLDEVYLRINQSEWARMKYIDLDPVVKQIDYFIRE